MAGPVFPIVFVLALLIGVVTVVGAPWMAIPIVLVAGAVLGVMGFTKRQRETKSMRGFREQASTDKADFDERDRATQVEDRA